MLQDDSWAIVERSCIVAEAMNDAIQRRQDWRASFHKNVEAKMDRAPFRTIVAFRLEGIACVNRASFVVPADAYSAIRISDAVENVAAEQLDVGYIRQVAQFAAADAQVKHNLVSRAQVWFNHAPDFILVAFQPAHDCICVWAGWQVAGVAKCIVGQPWVGICKFFEQYPRGLFADSQIFVVRLQLLLVCRVDHADAQPDANQRVEYCHLCFSEWKRFVVASNDMRSSREWISLTHHRISGSDSKLADCVRVHHVAKVDHADDLPAFPGGVADQDIVVVGIIVNDTHAQRRQRGQHLCFKGREKTLDNSASFRLYDVLEIIADPPGTLQVPLQCAMRSGMREILQCAIHPAQQIAEAGKQFGGVGARFREKSSRNVGEQPSEVGRAIPGYYLRDALACGCEAYLRQQKRRVVRGQALQSPVLHIKYVSLLFCLCNLQHELSPAVRLQVEVVVTLSRQ